MKEKKKKKDYMATNVTQLERSKNKCYALAFSYTTRKLTRCVEKYETQCNKKSSLLFYSVRTIRLSCKHIYFVNYYTNTCESTLIGIFFS